MKVLANDGISELGKSILSNAGFQVITDKVDQADLASYLNKEKIEILLVRSATKVREDLISQCPGLKLIGRGGVGLDNIDVAFAETKGIKVINTPASSSQSVAELVVGHMFALSRFLYDSYKNMESQDFSTLKKKYSKGIELRGKTIGIVGFGRIGQSLASYCLGMGMKVIAFDQSAFNVVIPMEIGSQKINLEVSTNMNLMDKLGELDFISLHVPKQKDGSAVITKESFDKMKNGVRIVNAARGGVIDESDLLDAIKNGKVAACALDVFENEPNPRQDLLSNASIASTPHIGAATLEAQDRIGEELAQKIIEQFG